MQRYREFLADFGRYVWAQRHLLGTFTVSLLSVGLVWLWPDVDVIRYWGVALQLLGVTTVAAGIRDTRRRFGQRGLFREARQKLAAFPRLRPKAVSTRLVGTVGSLSAVATARASGSGTLTLTTQEQIDALRQGLSNLQAAFDQAQQATDHRFAQAGRQLSEEQDARTKAVEDVRRGLADAQTGGLDLAVFGTTCLMIGALLGGAPQEVLNLVRFLPKLLG